MASALTVLSQFSIPEVLVVECRPCMNADGYGGPLIPLGKGFFLFCSLPIRLRGWTDSRSCRIAHGLYVRAQVEKRICRASQLAANTAVAALEEYVDPTELIEEEEKFARLRIPSDMSTMSTTGFASAFYNSRRRRATSLGEPVSFNHAEHGNYNALLVCCACL